MEGLLPLGDAPLLSLIVFLPLASVLGLGAVELFVGRLGVGIWRGVALVASLIGFLLALDLYLRFDLTLGTMQFVEHVPWIPEYGVSYYLGADGISLLLVLLTTFLLPVVLLAVWNDVAHRIREFTVFILALQTGMLGAFLSLNLFLFYVFWEAMLIPMYFVIGIWGGPRRLHATLKFLIFTMLGSLLMLVAILVLAFLHYQQTGVLTFDYLPHEGSAALVHTIVPTRGVPFWQSQTWLFVAFALAFGIKVPLFPLHTWLPDASVEAPTAGSALLAGVLLKLGAYGFLRYAIPLFPAAALELGPWLVGLALIGIVYAALVAMVQHDLKRLVAYTSISHLGLVTLGLFALNAQGVQGAVLQMVSHGVATGGLFLLVGMLYERRHTLEIDQLGGLAHAMPLFSVYFGVTALAAIGLPGLSGFVGELLVLLGAFGREPAWGVIAASGLLLSAAYMLWMLRRVFFGPLADPAGQKLTDLTPRERLVASALLVPLLWIGVYPATFYGPLDRSLAELLGIVEARGADLETWRPHAPEAPVIGDVALRGER